MVDIEWTIKVGDLLEIAVFAAGGIWFLFRVRGDADNLSTGIGKLETNFSQLEAKMGKLTDTVGELAVTQEKIEAVNRRLDDEKREGVEFRQWLRTELARMWNVIDDASKETKQMNQSVGELQGRVSAMTAHFNASESG